MLKFEHPTFKDVLSRPGRMGFIRPKTEETFCQSRLSLLTSATSSCNDINAVSNTKAQYPSINEIPQIQSTNTKGEGG